ncbi:MAG: ADP-ribosylglycohydrolase family protein [Candidatus Nanopelagicales bacterium]
MTNTTKTFLDAQVGALYGMAYGDAIGAPTEFVGYEHLIRQHGNMGPEVPLQLRITDDTQMSLAVWSALDAWDGVELAHLRMELIAAFRAWAIDPRNNRAPGDTCMSSIGRLERWGMGRWLAATSSDSAGCGSVMRAPWIGLHPKVTEVNIDTIAAMQAVITHGPAENAFTSIAAARLTRSLANGSIVPGQCSEYLEDMAHDMRSALYDTTAFSDLYRVTQRTDVPMGSKVWVGSKANYVVEGAGHVGWVAGAAAQLRDELRIRGPWSFDPCEVAGEGWRAREALALAVGILDADVLCSGSDLLRRAALSNGDSDSIGAILGALAGAAWGNKYWPVAWEERLEDHYAVKLTDIVTSLA